VSKFLKGPFIADYRGTVFDKDRNVVIEVHGWDLMPEEEKGKEWDAHVRYVVDALNEKRVREKDESKPTIRVPLGKVAKKIMDIILGHVDEPKESK